MVKRFRQFFLLVLLLQVLLLQVLPVQAGQTPFRLVSGADYAPYVSDSLPQGGVVAEVVSRVVAEMGYQPELAFFPWNRGYQQVLNLQSDATFPYAWGEERAEQFWYSRAVNRVTIRIFMQSSSGLVFQHPADLAGMSYCQPLGYLTEPELDAMINDDKVIRFHARDMDSCFEMLAAGRVDFVVANDLVGWDSAWRVLGVDADEMIKAADQPYRSIPEYLIISRRHPDGKALMAGFNQAYEDLLQQGELDQIWRARQGRYASAVR